MDESDDESENSEDRRFIASESEEEDEAEYTDEEEDEVDEKKKIEMEAKDDTVDALIEGMDEQTLLLYQQSLAEEACQSEQQRPRRSKRRRTRPKSWYELHPEDVKILLEDTTPQEVCQQEDESQEPEDGEDSYQPSDSD
jgi:hypothetical protein